MRRLVLTLFFSACLATGALAQNFESIEQKAPERQGAAQAATQPAATDACKDDPRLESEILTLLQSTEPITPPIAVTPDTFINLDPELLQALAGQMIICPNTPVLKSGKPARKVVADFEVIWDNVRKAAIANDEARLKDLLTNYRAKPKSAQEIVNMLSPTDLNEESQKILYKAAGLKAPGEGETGETIDIFKVLGGVANDKTFVIVHFFDHNKSDREELEKEFGKYIDLKTGSREDRRITNKLKSVSVNAINK